MYPSVLMTGDVDGREGGGVGGGGLERRMGVEE